GFLSVMAFLTAAIWFIGVHGPSVTRPFLTPFMYTNLANNQAVFAQGGHPHWALTYEMSYDFTSSIGGTGATFVIPILLILFAKSKQLKAVGFASYIPIWFQVNEPALFGCPLILNPIVVLPFVILPIINVVIYKTFIEYLGMNGAIVDVPWSIPAIVGLLLGTSFQWQAVALWMLLCFVDFIIWMPFILLYDKVVCGEELISAKEKEISIPLHYNYFTIMRYKLLKGMGRNKELRLQYSTSLAEIKEEIKVEKIDNKQKRVEEKAFVKKHAQEQKAQKIQDKLDRKNNVNNELGTDGTRKNGTVAKDKDMYRALVICYGAGTSAMFATSARKGAAKKGINNIEFLAASYGNHRELMKDMDLVILSPQVKVYANEIKEDVKHIRANVVFTTAKQYVNCTNSSEAAIEFILTNLPELKKTEE
ncbi:MAG: PTS transporter subunit EIIC, partial [Mycoplasmataceae bacterium]|nr:PTS transporter subunit EIIC [Mycoplasmataceae bacterium]